MSAVDPATESRVRIAELEQALGQAIVRGLEFMVYIMAHLDSCDEVNERRMRIFGLILFARKVLGSDFKLRLRNLKTDAFERESTLGELADGILLSEDGITEDIAIPSRFQAQDMSQFFAGVEERLAGDPEAQREASRRFFAVLEQMATRPGTA